jgi:hypothetical protein
MPATVTRDALVTRLPKTRHGFRDTRDASPQDHAGTVHTGHGASFDQRVTKITSVTRMTRFPIYERLRGRVHTRGWGEHRHTRHGVIRVIGDGGDQP